MCKNTLAESWALNFSTDVDFAASPERVMTEEGYTLDNVVLICAEFNSTCNQGEGGDDADEDSQWTREKANEWFAWLESPEGRAYVASRCAVPMGPSL